MFTLIFLGAERLGVRHGDAPGAASPLPWALLAAGVLVGFVYLRRQWHMATPLFPVDLLRIPVFALSMGIVGGRVLRADAGLSRTAVPAARHLRPLATAGGPA